MQYCLVLLLPFLGFLAGSLFGTVLGISSVYIAISFLFLTCVISISLLYTITKYGVIYKITLGNWISVSTYNIFNLVF